MRLFTLLMVSVLWWTSYQALAGEQKVSNLLNGDASHVGDQLEVQTLTHALLSMKVTSKLQGMTGSCDEEACDERALRTELARQILDRLRH